MKEKIHIKKKKRSIADNHWRHCYCSSDKFFFSTSFSSLDSFHTLLLVR